MGRGCPNFFSIVHHHRREALRRAGQTVSAAFAYGGAVGYFSCDGNMDLAITIRTIEVSGSRLKVQAGCGIVADSVPEMEYQETLNKARALFKAVEFAQKGFK